jgi:PilZ domain
VNQELGIYFRNSPRVRRWRIILPSRLCEYVRGASSLSMDNRSEPRLEASAVVRIWGMSADGEAFFQNVRANNLSTQGASLSEVEYTLSVGDVIGLQIDDKKARCRVTWVIEGGPLHKRQVGVQLLEDQPCPWQDHLTPAAPAPKQPQASGHEKRRFLRHKIQFPVELRDEHGGPPLKTSATDIGGRGCYVETLMPLPYGSKIQITFWIENQKVSTPALIRTSDPGVGMGIEFTGLDPQGQQRLQEFLQKIENAPRDLHS